MNLRLTFTAAAAAMLFLAAFRFGTEEYAVDTKKSTMKWVGRKVLGSHEGTIGFSKGKFVTNGKSVTGGSFEIDMTSMTNSDISDEGSRAMLLGHLKSDDFFSVEKYPSAKFVITKVTPKKAKDQFTVRGNLTIKGITKPLEFPATISTTASQIRAKAKIVVDRTKYDIRYGSGSFFDNLGDKTISDEFELNADITATR